ncbi:MAG: hypothetical protein KF690_08180, partial [Bacteroidetes bacterium]|nr:hypothetical protein [Bacteroidota bacterium]
LSAGQTDLFLTPAGSLRPTPLTKDLWDDRHPVWTPEGNGLYLASNRGFEIARTPEKAPAGMEGFDQPLNLYLLEEYAQSPYFSLLHLTQYYAERPLAATAEGLFAATDYSGLPNLGFYAPAAQDYRWSTDYREGLLDARPLNPTEWLAWGVHQGRHAFVRIPAPQPDARLQPARNRESLHWETRYKRVEALRAAQATPAKPETTVPPVSQDTTQKPAGKDTVRVRVRYYVFDEDDVPPTRPQRQTSRFAPGGKKPDTPKRVPPELFRTDSVRITAALTHKPGLLMRGVQSDIITDPYAGIGADARLLLQDPHSYHNLLLGARPYTDMRSIDVYARYHYRQYRLQPFTTAIRQSRFFGSPDYFSYRIYRLTQGLEYAHSQFMQYGLSASFAHTDRRDVNLLDVLDKDGQANTLTLSAHWRYRRIWQQDFLHLKGQYLAVQMDAQRGKGVHAQTLRLDARHFQPLFRYTVLALRLTGGASWGDARQQFMMGGIDNWVFRYDFANRQDIPLNQDVSALYLNQVGPYLRGTPFNNRNGWQYFTGHAEWRLPVTRLFNNSLYSGPLYNVQLLAFYELGTVWRTGNPLSQKNPIDASTIRRGPITAVVQSLKSPFVQSFGLGFRTLVLGYFTRFDLSWPLEEDEVVGTRFSIGVGKDF